MHKINLCYIWIYLRIIILGLSLDYSIVMELI